jgi:hypothetical protein
MPRRSSTIFVLLRSVVILCVLALGHRGSVAAEFTLPDTISIAAGEQREIPLIGSIEAGGATMIRLRYSPNVIRVVRARGSATTSLYCVGSIPVSDSIVSRTLAYADIMCGFSRPAVNDTVCFVTVEGIGGPDRTGSIIVDSVIADSTGYSVTSSTGGFVVRTGVDVGAQQSALAITGNYPNPFFLQTRIDFVLPKDEVASFTMRTIQGRAIRTWTVSGRAGENTTDLSIQASEAATGMYVLEMVTDSGVAYHSMRVLP